MTNEEKIWSYLKAQGLTDAGIAGLMGNLYAESGLIPTNLQNTYEKKLGYTDASYTAAVDIGSYTNFVKDGAGYGLAQWTYWSRKAALLAYAKSNCASIGALETQLGFLMQEMSTSFKNVLTTLKTATTVRAASDAVLTQFECPSDQSEAVKSKRAGYGQAYFDKYAQKGSANTMGFTNSPLVTYIKISPNKTSPRTHAIDIITIHCVVGQWTAKQGCDYFAQASVGAAPNYFVGKDGSIGLCVEEKDRAWCSGGVDKNGNPILVNGISGSMNDHRAITIEVASDLTHPYAVTDAAYNALVELLADICRRNGIIKLLWQGDKSLVGQVDKQNMTVHRWFANKACPGDYLYERHGDIAAKVNAKLGVAGTAVSTVTESAVSYTVRITVTDLNIRSGPGTGYASKGHIAPGVYTIVEESSGAGASKWGKLKSGAGWVSLDYCKKL